ncbi:hypothetical protein SALCHL_006494 [Streptomyces albus subsp. chlorinus]|uniref:SbtR family transcriptional regulator n=1 Tax=Streptomyces albus TaxID=1888 RepID=UPI0031F6AFAD
MIASVGSELLARAHQAHAVRPGVTLAQLLTLVGAIALATENEPDGTAATVGPRQHSGLSANRRAEEAGEARRRCRIHVQLGGVQVPPAHRLDPAISMRKPPAPDAQRRRPVGVR